MVTNYDLSRHIDPQRADADTVILENVSPQQNKTSGGRPISIRNDYTIALGTSVRISRELAAVPAILAQIRFGDLLIIEDELPGAETPRE